MLYYLVLVRMYVHCKDLQNDTILRNIIRILEQADHHKVFSLIFLN